MAIVKNENPRFGDIFFYDIEIIKRTRFSHYLISHEWILEINSMKSIYLGLKEIEEMIDEYRWGILYPIYKFYRHNLKKLRIHYVHW